MKRLAGGSLRAAGYDEREKLLVVELTSGTFQYAGVSPEVWRRFSSASSPWSYFRDNIEEEFAAKRVSGSAPAARNPLDELFRKP
jgi:KTSC domain